MIDNASNPAAHTGADALFDSALTSALEQQPQVAVPADFAARLMTLLPAQPVARPRSSAARIAATAAAAASLLALCWLAPHAVPNFQSVAFDMELAFLAELAAIAAWFASVHGKI